MHALKWPINCTRTRTAAAGSCIARGSVDQRLGFRDGHFQPALTGVPLIANVSYEFLMSMDAARAGYVVADALLVESHTKFNGGGEAVTAVLDIGDTVSVGAMDARILVTHPPSLKTDDLNLDVRVRVHIIGHARNNM